MDLLIVIVLSLLLMPLALLTAGALRVVVGLAFVLFFPGYALVAALFPRADQLGHIERTALSFGLSIASVALMGLALNYTPWGIRLNPILVCVLLFILIMSAIAWYRRRRLPPEDRFGIHARLRLSALSSFWVSQRKPDRIIAVILIVAIAAAIGTLGYVMATPKVGEKYTEFYILGVTGKAENYPKEIVLGQEGRVILGIVNHEQESEVYRVEIAIDGEKVQEIGPVNLKVEEKWEQQVAFTPKRAGSNEKVEFLLYKGGSSAPFNALHLWVNVK